MSIIPQKNPKISLILEINPWYPTSNLDSFTIFIHDFSILHICFLSLLSSMVGCDWDYATLTKFFHNIEKVELREKRAARVTWAASSSQMERNTDFTFIVVIEENWMILPLRLFYWKCCFEWLIFQKRWIWKPQHRKLINYFAILMITVISSFPSSFCPFLIFSPSLSLSLSLSLFFPFY